MDDQTATLNRRQRVDEAEANLDRAVLNAAAAEKRKMRAMQEMTDSDERLTACVGAVEQARVALGQALAYRDPAPVAAQPAAEIVVAAAEAR